MGDSGTPSAFTKPDVGRGWLHALTIYRIEHGHTRRELTTGAGRPCPALAWWGEPEPPVRPCSCRYFHERTRMVIHEGRHPQSIFLVVGTGFAIDRDCRHHGDTALIHPIGEPVDPRFWDTLDELERGNR